MWMGLTWNSQATTMSASMFSAQLKGEVEEAQLSAQLYTATTIKAMSYAIPGIIIFFLSFAFGISGWIEGRVENRKRRR